MKKAILATKVGMTQIFNEDGSLVPVTVLQAGPCVVTQIKTVDNDGYEAVQVGFAEKKERITNKDANGKKEYVHAHGVNKAMKGHFDKAGTTTKRYVREFKLENVSDYALGAEIKAARTIAFLPAKLNSLIVIMLLFILNDIILKTFAKLQKKL